MNELAYMSMGTDKSNNCKLEAQESQCVVLVQIHRPRTRRADGINSSLSAGEYNCPSSKIGREHKFFLTLPFVLFKKLDEGYPCWRRHLIYSIYQFRC